MKKLFSLLTLLLLLCTSAWGGVNVFTSVSQVIVDGDWTITSSSASSSNQSNVIFPDPAAETGFPVGTQSSSIAYYGKIGSSSNLGSKLATDKRITILGLSEGDIITLYWFVTGSSSTTINLSYASGASAGLLIEGKTNASPTSKQVYCTSFTALSSTDIDHIENGYAESAKLAYISCNQSIFIYAVKITGNVAPSFTAPTVDQSVSYEVDEVVASPLSVTATGTPDPTLQWYSNTSATTAGATTLTGNTNSTYTPSTAAESELYYYCVATNSQGSATSPFFHVVVSEGICPDGISISGTKEYYVGDDIELTAALEAGNGAITYQWYKGGLEDANVLDGETSSTLTIASCALGDAGSYYCVASKYGCLADAESAAFPVSVIAVPNNGVLFSANAKAKYSVPVSTDLAPYSEITSTYATISGGNMYAHNGQTSAKDLVNSDGLFVFTNNNTNFKVVLSNALQAGDKISCKVGNSKNYGIKIYTTEALGGYAADNTDYDCRILNTTGSFGWGESYFIESTDANLVGATTIYLYRATANGTYFDELTITRPYTRSVTSGNWGTICLPYAVAASDYSGATFYSIAGKRVDGSGDPTSIVLSEEDGDLVAGRPYIFQATANILSAFYSGDVASAGSYNGLIGSITGTSVASGMYIIYNDGDTHEVRKAGTGVTIGANKAYINLGSGEGSVPVYVEAGDAPGRLVEIPLAPNNATSLEEIESIERAVKFIQNGQLYITRGGVTYDALGRIVR